MDANSPASPPPAAAGGTVAPAQPAARSLRPALGGQALHYELRDPFAEVTYRTTSLDKIIAHAERLGAVRFQSIDPQGQRSSVERHDGRWQRIEKSEPDTSPKPKPAIQTADVQAPPAPGLDKLVVRIEAEAARAAHLQRIEEALHERYVIKRPLLAVGGLSLGHTEYRFRGDLQRIAFTESSSKLSTDTNHPSVARSMVDVAEARQWKTLRVSGHDDFKRAVWMEASLRGLQALGYEPQANDWDRLREQLGARLSNRIAPVHTSTQQPTEAAGRPSARGSGGRKAVLAALEEVLVARRVPAKQREAVMSAATASLSQRTQAGEIHRVKVLDKTAPARPPAIQPPMQSNPERSRERPGPAR